MRLHYSSTLLSEPIQGCSRQRIVLLSDKQRQGLWQYEFVTTNNFTIHLSFPFFLFLFPCISALLVVRTSVVDITKFVWVRCRVAAVKFTSTHQENPVWFELKANQ